MPEKFKHILVAIHGIGAQSRNATLRSVATRFATSQALLPREGYQPVAPQPLGFFYADPSSAPIALHLDDRFSLAGTNFEKIGFTEVYWADIPQELVNEGRTLEETKAWARTVVRRAESLGKQAKECSLKDPSLPPIDLPDFTLASEVLEEIIDTVYVLENLTFLGEKAGICKFDLRKLLEEYVGDVQVVAEFGCHRDKILAHFDKVMESIYAHECARDNRKVQFHIVAHSEGTVIGFVGLLRALKKAEPNGWISRVRGFMTMGSPIDKHLLLWHRMWDGLDEPWGHNKKDQIWWRNYFDHGDPVGFKLDTARAWLKKKKLDAFQFGKGNDHGFTRYLFPGKAHVDYWEDKAVFEHFITNVVRRNPDGAPPPADRWLVKILSPFLPYAFSMAVLLTGVFILYKAVSLFSYPNQDPMVVYTLRETLGIKRTMAVSGQELLLNVVGVTGLIAGTTLLGRLPRLAAGRLWKFVAILGFEVGAAAYYYGVKPASQEIVGSVFSRFGFPPTAAVIGCALIAGIIAFLIGTGPASERRKKQRPWFRKGMRPVLLSGGTCALLVVGGQLFPPRVSLQNPGFLEQLTTNEAKVVKDLTDLQRTNLETARIDVAEFRQFATNNRGLSTRMENLANVGPLLQSTRPLWPVALATAAFIYLWWLAACMFDLAFIWHRYIRNSVAVERLNEWRKLKQTDSSH